MPRGAARELRAFLAAYDLCEVDELLTVARRMAALPAPEAEPLPTGWWRPLSAAERRADLAGLRERWDTGTADLGAALAQAGAELTTALRERVRRSGLAGRGAAPAAVQNLTLHATVRAQLRQRIERALVDAYVAGGAVAKKEVRSARRALAEPVGKLRMANRPARLILPRAQAYFRALSFYVTGVLENTILRNAKQVLFNALRQDKTESQVLAELDRALNEFIPVRDAAGRAVNVPARLETIARTNISTAVNEGRWAVLNDPDLQGFVRGVQYSAVMDERTRETHAAWDGVTRPLDDPVWFGPPDNRPPNGFNCRCTLIAVTAADAPEWTPDEALPREPAADEGGFFR